MYLYDVWIIVVIIISIVVYVLVVMDIWFINNRSYSFIEQNK